MSSRRERLLAEAEAARGRFEALALKLHAHPEIGLEEKQASDWLCAALQGEGFEVERGVAELPTAFVARKGREQAKPVIAFLAEYDALPGLGHACGHNLIAAAALLAGTALARTVGPDGAQVRVIGCPAEESYGGKAQLVERGVLSGVDAVLMIHGYYEHRGARPASGRQSVVIEFHGKASHAAASPEIGVNALDAMILTFNAVGLMRQQLRDEARIHGIITHGGQAANIIPDYTRAEFYVRSSNVSYLQELAQRLQAAARGAAEATGTKVTFSSATLTMLPIRHNRTMEGRYEENLRALGEVVPTTPVVGGAGSTDFGNVSQVIPGAHGYFKVSSRFVKAHTTEFAEAARSAEGLAGMVAGAKAMALTGLDLIEDPELLEAARREFQERASS